MTFPRPLTLAALAFALALGPGQAWAGPAGDHVKAKEVQLRALVADGKAKQTAEVDAVFDQLLDYGAIARGSLGKQWDSLTEAQRAEFTEVLTKLVRAAYRRNLEKTAGYAVEYTGETDAEGGLLVTTVAKSKTRKREEPVEIAYLVHQVEGQWRVRDIVTEGSSLVRSYRTQFGKLIKKDGFDGLMKKMRRKLEKGG